MNDKRFNQLSNAEDERLSILVEELGEAIQIIGKIKRFGYKSFHPHDKDEITNRSLLEEELGHIQSIVGLMVENKDLRPDSIDYHGRTKSHNRGKYLKHQ